MAASFAADKKTRIKFATLAPEGSSWMKEMRRLADEVKQKTEGRVSFKFYPGGVSGDERDVIRKMRIGQIHAAGFTGVGLGQILPEVRVLDLPFLFETDDEIQHVYEKMNGYFAKKFEEKGYVLLGWVPVGWVHFFSTQPVGTVADIKKTKPWMWEGDPLVKKTYEALGVKPVPLSVTDVLMSLQTGLLDTIYASPQGALALQWFTKVKYMSELRMGYATGAVLISKKKFNGLPDDCKPILKKLSEKYLKQLVQTIQKDNAASIKIMNDNGVQLIKMPGKEVVQEFHQAGAVARKNLVGKLFSPQALEMVLNHLREVK
ncbi:MAG: ABC transporter substrate-binding protein [Nitrospinaceae bacterium]|nr:MAG: ABC transporter substrate-binding protein [Nitrospinaceae bacterium]